MTLDTTAAEILSATTSAAGAIIITETDGIILTNVVSNDGLINVTAGGAVTATNVVSTNNLDANDITIQGTSIAVGNINSGAAGDVTLTATTGAITDNNVAVLNITADNLILGAVTGISTAEPLELVVNSLTGTTTGGAINLSNTPTGTVTINGLTTGNASNITYAQTGQHLTIAEAISSAGGDILIDPPVDIAINANVTTTGIGTIIIQGSGAISTANGVIVSTDAGLLTIEGSAAGNEAASLTMADNSSILSTTGTITLRANAMTLDNVGTGGNVLLDSDTGVGAVITQLAGFPGKVVANNLTIQQDDTNLVTIATAVTSLNVVGGNTVTVVEDNDIVVNSVVTAAAGTFNLTATAGAITNDDAGATPDIVTGIANLNAVGGIDVDTTVTSLTAATTGVGGNIQIDETNAITLTSVTTTDGAITVNAGGTMTAAIVTAGGAGRNVSLTTTVGDVNVGAVTAAGDTATIMAAGAIQGVTDDNTADVLASIIDLNAATGIGSTTTLDVTGTTISADTTTGAIDIDSLATGAVTVTSLTTGTGSITFDQTGSQTLGVTLATTTDGAIAISNDGGNLTASTVTAGGANGITLTTTTSGDVNVGAVTAAGDLVTVTAAGAIQSVTPNGVADIVAATIDLNAVTGIGSVGGALDVTGTTISADTTNGNIDIDSLATGAVTVTSLTTGTGDINFDQTGSQTLGITLATTTTGDITITNAGATLTAATVTAGGVDGDVILTTTVAGNVLVGSVTGQGAGGSVTINSFGAIEESGGYVGADITAVTIDLNAVTGIGASATLEITGTTISADTTDGNIDIDSLATVAVTVASLSTGTGSITFDQTGAQTLEVTSAQTTLGDITITNAGASLQADWIEAGGDPADGYDITLTTTGSGNIITGILIASNDIVNITAAGAITDDNGDGVINVYATTLNASAGGAINLDTNVAGITATTSVAGAITLREFDAVTLTNVIAFDGPITVTAGGAVTALNVVSTNDAEANDISITGTSIAVGTVNAGATAGDVTLTATTGAITDNNGATNNVTAQVVDLNAATGIGAAGDALEMVVRTLTADTTAGVINLVNVPGAGNNVTINSMTTGGPVAPNPANTGAAITYKQTGENLTIAGAISSGGGNIWIDPPVDIAINANVTTTGSGTILIQGSGAISTANGVVVSTDTGTLTIEGAASGAEAVSLTMANNSSIFSTSGTITLRANTMTLDNVGTGGNVLLDSDAAAGDITTLFSGVGAGKINANNLTILQDDGSAVNIASNIASLDVTGGSTVTLVEDNDIVVNAVTTVAGGTFNLISSGAITNNDAGATPDIVTGTANLQAVGGIDVDTSVATLRATTSGVGGNIQIDETDAITLSNTAATVATVNGNVDIGPGVTTVDGAITVNAGGTITAQLVTAGGVGRDLTLNATGAGDVLVGAVTAAGDTATITAAGAIQGVTNDDTADVLASIIDLNAATGIGSTTTLDVTGTTISADTTTGAIDIDSLATGAVTVTSLTTAAGNIQFDQTGGQTLAVTNADTDNGDITITNVGATLTVTLADAGGADGDVILTTTTAGDVLVGSVTGQGATGSVTINSAGAIQAADADGTADVVAVLIDLNAATGIGTGINGALDVTGTTISADTTTGAIDIDSLAIAAVTVTSLTTAAGDIQFDQTGNQTLAVTNADTNNGDITITNVGATLTVTLADAGGADGDVILTTTTAGDVLVGSVTGQGATGSVTINSVGAIQAVDADGTADVVAVLIDLNAATGIGTGVNGALDVTGTTISADTTTGAIDIDSLAIAAVTVTSLTTALGDITFDQTGSQTLAVTNADTNDGNITITNAGADMTVTLADAGGADGDVILTTTGAGSDIFVDSITGQGATGSITITSAALIEELMPGDAGIDLTATTIALTAVTGIGTNAAAPIEIAATTITGLTGTGGVNLTNTSSTATTIRLESTTSGNITYTQLGTAGGTLTVERAVAGAGDVTISVAATATDMVLGGTTLAGVLPGTDDISGQTVMLTAGHSILDRNDGATPVTNITASVVAMLRAETGVIGEHALNAEFNSAVWGGQLTNPIEINTPLVTVASANTNALIYANLSGTVGLDTILLESPWPYGNNAPQGMRMLNGQLLYPIQVPVVNSQTEADIQANLGLTLIGGDGAEGIGAYPQPASVVGSLLETLYSTQAPARLYNSRDPQSIIFEPIITVSGTGIALPANVDEDEAAARRRRR